MAGTFSFRRGRRNGPDRSAVNIVIKYLIFFVNVIVVLLGTSLIVVSIYVLVEKDKVIRTVIDFLFDPSCLLCLAGSISVIIAFFGLVGSLRENIPFLRIYYVTLSFVLLIEIVIIVGVFVFYYVPDARSMLNPEALLKDAIVNYRDDDDMRNFIDTFQQTLTCCGLSNDDKGYLNWNDNIYFNCSASNKSPESCAVPFSCCNIQAGDKINILCGGGALNEPEASSQLSQRIYTQGCLKGIQVAIDGSALMIGGIIIGILLPQAFLICISKSLIEQIQEQMAKWR